MGHSAIDRCIKDIQNRQHIEGGFSEIVGGSYRPDSTSWAILTLARSGIHGKVVETARLCLAKQQFKDGRVSMPGDSRAFWPTPLVVLALHGSKLYGETQSRALRFLLETSGKHWKKDPASPISHDTSIQGWPWTEETHSFVEPTAMALIALDIVGQAGHPRFEEGSRMLMDRQLPHGGWNYGNTKVYGQELHPFVDTTGIALTALAGHVSKKNVGSSIQFLKERVEQCRTPLSLGWTLFGLGAWGESPLKVPVWIEQSLKRQEKYGAYGTSLLSLLALVSICQGEFRQCVA